MDLMQELDRAIGDGPEHRPVDQRIKAGRRAVRRRRAGAAVAGVAVVAALGTTYSVASPGHGDRTISRIAVAPTPTSDEPSKAAWEDKTPARYAPDGQLEIAPGVVVHQHIENPFGYHPPRQSDALDLTFEGQRMWVVLDGKPGGYGFSSSLPSDGWASFADYVADQVDGTTGGAHGWPATLRLTADGRVVATPGSEILQRTDDPQLGDAFAPPGTPTGAALVRAADDGVGYFVVWRVVDGSLDVITVPPKKVEGATFDELLTAARAKYASGEGLR